MSSTRLKLSTVKVEVDNSAESLLACRICLASDVKLFNIREWGLEQVFVELMGTTLSAWDDFPQHLCVFCRALLVKACRLRTRCRRAEQLLRQSLVHQQSITTSFIRTIDRHSHRLTHPYSHDCSNRDVKIFKHEHTDTHNPNNYVLLIENNIKSDVDCDTIVIDDDDDYVPLNDNLDTDTKTVDIEFDDLATPADTPKVNIVESDNKTVNTLKRKARNKNGTEKKKRVRKTKNKGLAWRLKPFNTEEHFREFQEKYNIKVVALSEEDMIKDMADRKNSDNYIHSVFKCELCFKGFLSINTYNNHMKIHDLAQPHACRLCHKRYYKPDHLRRHTMNTHRLRFLCLTCNESVNSKASAMLHAAFHSGKTFQCDFCDQQFLKVTSRSTHMRMSHAHEFADGGTCEICGETFIGAVGLKAHKTRSHEALPGPPSRRCRTCKVRFESAASLERHRSMQPGGKCDNKHSSCPKCGEACASEQDLLAHRMQQHGLQLFTCDMCSKSFESKESLSTHIDRVHLLIRPPAPPRPGFRQKPRLRSLGQCAPVCEHCGKRVSCMAMLKVHMNKHTGEKPYKCTLCPKAYSTPMALSSHTVSHTGARKWTCKECPATFMHQSSLYQHRRAIHSGEKAYQCHICEKAFTQSGSLHTHIKYVHMKVKPPPRKRGKKTVTQEA